MRKRYFSSIVLLLLFSLLITSCNKASPTPQPPTQTPSQLHEIETATQAPPQAVEHQIEILDLGSIQGITWQWAAVTESMPASQSLLPSPESYLLILNADGSVNIQADCNMVLGEYTADGSDLTITPGPSTMAFCGEESSDQMFISYLGKVTQFGTYNGQLVLTFSEGDNLVQLFFNNGGMVQAPTTPIEDITQTVWQWASSIENDPAAATDVPNPENYTLIFRDDGSLNIQADCNMVLGSYVADGSNLSITLGPSTRAMCPEDSLEQNYLDLLSQVSTFGMSGEQLVLGLSESGELLFKNGGPAEAVEEPTPEVCAGIAISSIQLNLFDLPYSWQPTCIAETAYDNSQPPGPIGLPEHVEINFGLEESESDIVAPIIYIIPVASYSQLWNQNGDVSVDNTLTALNDLLWNAQEEMPTSVMPVLPFERVVGSNDIAVQHKYQSAFISYGLRFVGRFSVSPNAVTNLNPPLNYIYQGYTDDNQYLVSFFYPVSTPVLPDDVEGVPQEELDQLDQDVQGYMASQVQLLNGLNPSDWTPSLDTLDTLIASLTFEYQPLTLEQPEAITWQWGEYSETEPPSQSLIPDPYNYTVRFNQDGTVNVLADCNQVSGTYAAQDGVGSIELGVSTSAFCGETSLSDMYVNLLSHVTHYSLEGGVLTLFIDGGTARMVFYAAPTPDSE